MVSHKYKCVFVHIPKNAGSSIIKVLNKGDENKVVSSSYHWPENKFRPPSSHLSIMDYLNYKRLTKEQFQEYWKFCVVRNPWDRIVSEYKFRHFPRVMNFKTFLFKYLPKPSWSDMYCHVIPQYDFIYDNKGNCMVNYIARFENMKKEFRFICQKLDIESQRMPYVNGSKSLFAFGYYGTTYEKFLRLLDIISHRRYKNTFKHYSEYYDKESREYVAKLYKLDIMTFNYKFEKIKD